MSAGDEGDGWRWVLPSVAVAATAIDLGSVHRLHTADSLLPVLISVQHWEPFFWGQDRLGTLLPAIAMPVGDPFANLLLQDGLAIFAGLLAFFLLARFTRVPRAPWCGLLSAVAFLLCCPAPLRFEYLVAQPYGVSMALGLGGMLLWDGGGVPRHMAAFLLVVLAHWVNVGVWLALVPLALLRGVLSLVPLAGARDALLPLAGAAVGGGLMTLASTHLTRTALLPVRLWPGGWRALASHAAHAALPWLLAAALAAVVGTIAAARAPQENTQARRSAATLIGAAFLFGAAVGTAEWVRANLYLERYLLPTLVLLTTGLMALATVPLSTWAPSLRHAGGRMAIPVALLGAAMAAFGLPSLRGARADVDRVAAGSGWTEQVLAAGCTHVAGTYWQVWPTVFYGTLLLHERGEERALWGVTERGASTRALWERMAPAHYRVCVEPNDPEGPIWLERFGLPELVPVDDEPRLRVLVPSDVGGPR